MLRLLCLLFVCGVLSANADVTISSVDRTLDLSTQIVKAKLVFNLEGTGSSFVFALPQTDTNHLSYVTAYGEKASDKFKVSKTKNGAVPSDYVPYEVTLTRALAAGTKTKVTVEYALTQFLRPHPAEISQADNQFVVFNGDAYVASPLTIAKQRTILKLAGGKLESHTTLEPTKNTAGQITYGPYENVKPFTKAPIAVHFENNAPFVIAANIERHIEVSHWASRVSVEEHIELQHRGARLSGAFSRLDYQMDRRGQQQPALSHFTTRLPASAQHVYYRDVIGNISTSALRYKADAVEAEIRPRFPLFGGWKTNYVIGYTLPSNEYMLHNGADKYELKLRVLDHVLDNVVVEKLTVRVVLPEKSEDIKLVTPFTVQRRPDERLATYLDTTARPVVVFEKSNVVTYHMQPFTVTYTYGSSLMWREPAMLIAAFFALFAAVIVVVRFDFSLIKDAKDEIRGRAQSQVDNLAAAVDERNSIYDRLLAAVAAYRDSKDAEALTSTRKKIAADRSRLNAQIEKVGQELASSLPGVADKISELAKLDKEMERHENEYVSAVQRGNQKTLPEDATFGRHVENAKKRAVQLLDLL